MFVHFMDNSSTEQPGSLACQHSWCHSCNYISSVAEIQGPKCSFSIRDYFTCQSKNLVNCLSCRQCPLLYIRETGQSLVLANLQSMRNNTPGIPVAQHFNCMGHSISDVQVRGMHISFYQLSYCKCHASQTNFLFL